MSSSREWPRPWTNTLMSLNPVLLAEIEDGSLVKISLEKFRQNDDDDALHIIVYLGKLLKHLTGCSMDA